jgi:hypothetical protein
MIWPENNLIFEREVIGRKILEGFFYTCEGLWRACASCTGYPSRSIRLWQRRERRVVGRCGANVKPSNDGTSDKSASAPSTIVTATLKSTADKSTSDKSAGAPSTVVTAALKPTTDKSTAAGTASWANHPLSQKRKAWHRV